MSAEEAPSILGVPMVASNWTVDTTYTLQVGESRCIVARLGRQRWSSVVDGRLIGWYQNSAVEAALAIEEALATKSKGQPR